MTIWNDLKCMYNKCVEVMGRSIRWENLSESMTTCYQRLISVTTQSVRHDVRWSAALHGEYEPGGMFSVICGFIQLTNTISHVDEWINTQLLQRWAPPQGKHTFYYVSQTGRVIIYLYQTDGTCTHVQQTKAATAEAKFNDEGQDSS